MMEVAVAVLVGRYETYHTRHHPRIRALFFPIRNHFFLAFARPQRAHTQTLCDECLRKKPRAHTQTDA